MTSICARYVKFMYAPLFVHMLFKKDAVLEKSQSMTNYYQLSPLWSGWNSNSEEVGKSLSPFEQFKCASTGLCEVIIDFVNQFSFSCRGYIGSIFLKKPERVM